MKRSKIQIGVAGVMMLLLLGAVMVVAQQGAEVSAQEGTAVAGTISSLLQYQGRLSDPSSGELLADGSYAMVFRLYKAPSGGAALWKEAKDVPVSGGLFSTVLGDVTPLNQALFSGQGLWLGIKVGSDAEATPRQQVLPVAYALGLVPGAAVQANSSAAALSVSNSGSGQALHAAGEVAVDGNLTVSGALNGGDHDHSGADISSGTVAEGRIAAAIARDSEVTNAVNSHAAKAGAHHTRYTDAEAASAALSHPEIVTQYEFQDHIYGGMHNGRAIAYGSINEDGSVASATGNVSSRWWSLGKCYEITIDGHYYEWWSYVTVVTPVYGGGMVNVWGVDGKMCVSIYNIAGESQTRPFTFVTFKP